MQWMLLPAVAAVLAWPAAATLAQTTGAAKVEVEQSEEHGSYLTDADGRALYLFTTDQQGGDGTMAQSTCYDACADAWPPMLVDGEPEAGEQVDASLLGTFERDDGSSQVTYNGWPLYYFIQDQGPGEATGQDKHGFGGEWYLLTPEGQMVEEHG